jgi:cell wall-associated NlpC family hydrolase
MTIYERIAAEALALVDIPFRLHGRSEETGLDCVGLAALAITRAGGVLGVLPSYRLRGSSLAGIEAGFRSAGFGQVDGAAPGDLLVAESGLMQHHLMVVTARGHVHAHAGLGRVVLMPPPSPWPLLGRWRFHSSADRD